ncbi:hypothetical protein [Oryza sativa Japonica Group]|uniref:Uncharacterized protein n=1 Tax=Oryza sativa subsp. japonica TaxID=39947 RepID=Q5N805_ORYSJ|nr:hypothetical protein [Oryza sativa Japonica Group]
MSVCTMRVEAIIHACMFGYALPLYLCPSSDIYACMSRASAGSQRPSKETNQNVDAKARILRFIKRFENRQILRKKFVNRFIAKSIPKYHPKLINLNMRQPARFW